MTLGSILRLLVFGALWLVSTFSAQAEKRVALVIGNDRYTTLPTLQKAANDAAAVGDALAKLGFDVVRGRDLGRQAMIDKLAEFTAKLEAGDTAMFFYAGHGVAIGGVNYLVPADTPAATVEARVRGASITEADVVAEIQAKGARVAVLVIDACRDNPFPRAGTRMVGNTRGLTGPSHARGVFVLYSAGSGQTALDRLEKNDPNRNSVFTRVFVEHLAKPGIHLGELAVEVRERVAEIALSAKNDNGEPEPHEQTPAYYDQTIGGRIFLAGRSMAAEERKPAAPAVVQPAADEIAWGGLQDTSDVAALRRFTAGFPKSARKREAEARIASLEREESARAGVERKRRAAEQAAQDKAQREAIAKAEEERKNLAREQADRAKAERERAEIERVAGEKAERDRAERERVERARIAREQAEPDKKTTDIQTALLAQPAESPSSSAPPAPAADPCGAETMQLKRMLARGAAARSELAVFAERAACAEARTQARTRLAALDRSLTEPPKGEKPKGPSQSDGTWTVTWTGVTNCRVATGTYGLRIQDGVIIGKQSGKVSASGAAQWSATSRFNGANVNYVGVLKGSSGSGRFQNAMGCQGTFVARKN
jgi:hypothetical protein